MYQSLLFSWYCNYHGKFRVNKGSSVQKGARQLDVVLIAWKDLLTHCGLVRPDGDIDVGQHCFRQQLVDTDHYNKIDNCILKIVYRSHRYQMSCCIIFAPINIHRKYSFFHLRHSSHSSFCRGFKFILCIHTYLYIYIYISLHLTKKHTLFFVYIIYTYRIVHYFANTNLLSFSIDILTISITSTPTCLGHSFLPTLSYNVKACARHEWCTASLTIGKFIHLPKMQFKPQHRQFPWNTCTFEKIDFAFIKTVAHA